MSEAIDKEKVKQTLDALIALQEIDTEIGDLEKMLKIIPGQIAASQKELEGKTGRLKAAQALIDDLRKKRNQLEQNVKVENDHMAKVKGKLPTVKTNKEYTALLHETDAIKEKISAMEDQQLEIMEQLDEKETEIPGLEQEFKGYQAEFHQYKQNKEGEQKRIQQELDEVRARRGEVAGSIESKWVQHYDRVKNLRGGLSVVTLEGDICQGCYQQIRPQVTIEIKMGEKIHQCQHCSRYLYWVPKPETEDSNETAVPK